MRLGRKGRDEQHEKENAEKIKQMTDEVIEEEVERLVWKDERQVKREGKGE